jgi:hypothetical protein
LNLSTKLCDLTAGEYVALTQGAGVATTLMYLAVGVLGALLARRVRRWWLVRHSEPLPPELYEQACQAGERAAAAAPEPQSEPPDGPAATVTDWSSVPSLMKGTPLCTGCNKGLGNLIDCVPSWRNIEPLPCVHCGNDTRARAWPLGWAPLSVFGETGRPRDTPAPADPSRDKG